MPRPPAVDRHLNDLERFFGDDEWQFGTGHDFNAQRAVRSLRRYIIRLERQSPATGSNASRDKIRGLNTNRSSSGV